MIFQIAQSLFDVVGLVTVLDGGAKDFSEPVERILIHVVDPHQLLNISSVMEFQIILIINSASLSKIGHGFRK